MVVLTLALAVVTYLSLRVIRGQLGEMKSAGQQTDRMIEIAGKQAEGALKSADAATSAADSARKALLLSERAWVGVVDAQIEPLMLDTKAHAFIVLQNSSRAPPFMSMCGQMLGCMKDDCQQTLLIGRERYCGVTESSCPETIFNTKFFPVIH